MHLARRAVLVGVGIGMFTVAGCAAPIPGTGTPVAVAGSVTWATRGSTVAVLGDSYTAGVGADAPSHAWQYTMAQVLGWTVVQTDGDSGGGFVRSGTNGTFRHELIDHPLPAAVDNVVVQGGLNDRTEKTASMAPAVTSLLGLVRAQAPKAHIIVVGTFVPSSVEPTRNPLLLANADAIKTAATLAGAQYIDGRQCHFEIGNHGIHPTSAGHRELGTQIAHLIEP